jgi:Tol biopolymer transport system component
MPRSRLIALILLLAAAPAGAQYFGKNKVRYDQFDWHIYSTPHFRISFYDRVRPSLPKIASFAESAYDELARKLNFQITEPIPLIAYATHAEFEQTNVISDFVPEGVGAFATPARNRMVLPADLPDKELQQLIQHELTHIFQYEILFQGRLGKALTARPPHWFMEGMASYLGDDEDARARAVMRDAVQADSVPSVGQDYGGYFSYRYGHMVFKFIESEWGLEGVRDFVYEIRNTMGGNVARAIDRAFSMEIDEFDAQFKTWLRKYYQNETLDRGEPREFGREFRVESDDGRSVEASPVAAPSGDLIAAFSTYKDDVDVVVFGVPDRRLVRNLTKGTTTRYQYNVAQLLTIGPTRGRDLAFSPDGDTVAVFARKGRGRVLVLLNALKGGVLRDFDIPYDQATSPAYSPDGTTIAFNAVANGRSDIFLLDLASGEFRNITDDPPFDTAPAFTPDGTGLVYTSESGEGAKLFELQLAEPTRRRQLTFGPGDDEGAALSRDGKKLYFASDRDQGIIDLYALDLETRELWRLTRVVGAALNPMPVPTPDGERIIFQAYHRGGWKLFVTDPAQGAAAGVEEAAKEVTEREPFVPAVTVTVADDKIEKLKGRKLFVEDAQAYVGINQDQTLVSQAYVSLSDNYGDRRFTIFLESVEGYSNFRLAWSNLEKRLQWGATIFDDRAYFIGYDTTTGSVVRVQNLYRETGAALFAQYPLSLYYRLEGGVGYEQLKVNYPAQDPFTGAFGFIPVQNDVPFVLGGLVGDTTIYQNYGPHAGARWSLYFAQYFDATNGGTLSRDIRFEGRAYLPLSRRNELAFRLFTGYATGNQPTIYYFGGLDTLRGFDYRSIVGNQAAYLNAEWRFPLVDFLAMPFLRTANIRGRVFLDVGGAKYDFPGYVQPYDCYADGKLKDCVSSYGMGFSANIFGLPCHFDFAKRWNFDETLSDSLESTFWIGIRY